MPRTQQRSTGTVKRARPMTRHARLGGRGGVCADLFAVSRAVFVSVRRLTAASSLDSRALGRKMNAVVFSLRCYVSGRKIDFTCSPYPGPSSSRK